MLRTKIRKSANTCNGRLYATTRSVEPHAGLAVAPSSRRIFANVDIVAVAKDPGDPVVVVSTRLIEQCLFDLGMFS